MVPGSIALCAVDGATVQGDMDLVGVELTTCLGGEVLVSRHDHEPKGVQQCNAKGKEHASCLICLLLSSDEKKEQREHYNALPWASVSIELVGRDEYTQS